MKLRRIIILIFLSTGIVAIAIITFLLTHPKTVKSPIEAWIGTDLQRIANRFLNPELHFAKLIYRYPETVILHDLTLTAPDPLNPSKIVTILFVRTVRIELAEIPRTGKTLKISELHLDTTELHLIANRPPIPTTAPATQPASQPTTQLAAQPTTQPRPPAGFIGFSDFLTEKQSGPPIKPSDVFQITKIDIHNALIQYDARLRKAEPFTLDNLNTTLNVEPSPSTSTAPATSAASQPAGANGWYVLDLNISRAPIFSVKMQGRINVNTLAIEFSPLIVDLALNNDTKNHLPPNVQKAISQYQAQGTLNTILTGTLMLTDMAQTKLLTHINLTNAHVCIGQCQLPIQKLTAELQTENLLTRAKNFDIAMLNGTIHAEGSLPFRRADTASLHIRITNIGLARTLRTLNTTTQPTTATQPAASQPSSVAGRISGEISYSAPIKNWNTQASGTGHLILNNGRIPDLPLLGDIFGGIRIFRKSMGDGNGKPNDNAEISFLFQDDKLITQAFTAHTSAMAMRATGNIFFNGNVDLRVNAGPLERLELLLGPIGNLLGNVTDQIASYHVTGKPGQLTISPQVGPK